MNYIQILKTSFFFSTKYILIILFPLPKHFLEPPHLPTQPTSCCSFPLPLSEREKKKKLKSSKLKKENKIKDTQTKEQTYDSRLCAMLYRQNTRQGVQNNFYKYVRGL